jgi:hypothetical protein
MSKPNGLITTATDVSVREKITIQKSKFIEKDNYFYLRELSL